MYFWGDSGGPDDVVAAIWQGAKQGWVIGKWMGAVAAVIIHIAFKFTIIFLAAGIGAMGDFLRRFIAGWKS